MKITAVTCVKNEGPFIVEWVAYNRVIGVTDFLFYSNDCDDCTDLLLDTLEDHDILHHLPNPAQGRNYQMEALKHARGQSCVTGADWVWIADVDEFLNIHVGDGSIAELITACGDPEAISVTFQFFANDGVNGFEDRPVITQFQRSHNPDIWCDQLAQEVKTLIHKGFPVKYYGAHRPFITDRLAAGRSIRWTDGSGRQVPDNFQQAANSRRIRKFPAAGARRFATLNHYALRSLDSYLVKTDRGDVNRQNRAFDDSYWRERNDPAWHDPSILRHLDRLEAEIARLRTLEGVAELHDRAVALHRAKIDRLNVEPAYGDLRRQLQSAPRIPPQEEAVIAKLSLGISVL